MPCLLAKRQIALVELSPEEILKEGYKSLWSFPRRSSKPCREAFTWFDVIAYSTIGQLKENNKQTHLNYIRN